GCGGAARRSGVGWGLEALAGCGWRRSRCVSIGHGPLPNREAGSYAPRSPAGEGCDPLAGRSRRGPARATLTAPIATVSRSPAASRTIGNKVTGTYYSAPEFVVTREDNYPKHVRT